MFDFFKRKKTTVQPTRVARLRYDSAQTTRDNAAHWAAADFASADMEASADARQILRTRARYEVANNSYAKGIVVTLANDTVGTGPRLQLLTDDPEFNRAAERDFARWAKKVNLAEKLRTSRVARCQDGEAFILLVQNPKLPTAVQLDVQLIEADRIADGFRAPPTDDTVDGITFDKNGNVTSYRVLKNHPAGGSYDQSARTVSAKYMIHLFRADRPGMHRGVPELTPALPLFAQLRRYTLAVLAAAESAANFAGILYTDAPPDGESAEVQPLDTVELERNMLLTMPAGWKMGQVDPKQPTATYSEFKRELLNEIARCLNMPYNIAAGNSSGYNYASGRLDHQTYFKAVKVDRTYIEDVALDRILGEWLREYALANGHEAFDELPAHTWMWDGTEHVDPAKEANAQSIRLANMTTSLAAEYAKQGRDWEVEVRQIARERALLDELKLTTPPVQQQPEPNDEE